MIVTIKLCENVGYKAKFQMLMQIYLYLSVLSSVLINRFDLFQYVCTLLVSIHFKFRSFSLPIYSIPILKN